MVRQYTYDSGGTGTTTIREDLENVVAIMSPMDTPVQILLNHYTVHNTLFEFLVDEIKQPNAVSAKLEGAEPQATNRNRTRLANIAMVDHEAIDVSDTQRVVDEAAIEDEFSWQVVQKGLELLKRAEFNLHWSRYQAGNATTARQMAGMVEAMLGSGNGRANNSAETIAGRQVPVEFSSTLYDGGGTNLTEQNFRDGMLQPSWRNGMQIPSAILLVGARIKQLISDFGVVYTSGSSVVSSAWIRAESKRKILTIDVFETDYGPLSLALDRYMDDPSVTLPWTPITGSTGQSTPLEARADATALLIEPQFWEIAALRPLQYSPLAKTGDFTRGYNVVEQGIKFSNLIAGTIGIRLLTGS